MSTGQAVKQSADCLTLKMEELLSFETSVATSEHGVTSLNSSVHIQTVQSVCHTLRRFTTPIMFIYSACKAGLHESQAPGRHSGPSVRVTLLTTRVLVG